MSNILENLLKYYENHPSVFMKEFVTFYNIFSFSFCVTTPYAMESGIASLSSFKHLIIQQQIGYA